jgi:SAM-dependent methyltransferase
MTDTRTTVHVHVDVRLEPSWAFDLLVEELAAALARRDIGFDAKAEGGIVQGSVEVGRVVSWEPGARLLLRWRQADWDPDELTEVELRLTPADGVTRVALEHRGWGGLIGTPEDLIAWFAGEVAAPLLSATAPAAFGDWITDRRARRPSGISARRTYRDPLYHYPNFHAILDELALTDHDYLLEVGCGGGAFLRQALRTGCRAAAVDHSPDMVRLAREVNRGAIVEGRLEIKEADAERLPFPDGTFTCATMTGVLGFLPSPVTVLAEIRRVLREGGRLVVLGSDPRLRGTPAAPEPIASRLRFYEDDGLERLAQEAGFTDARVVRRNLEAFAREAGLPEEALPLFSGRGAPFLVASKDTRR